MSIIKIALKGYLLFEECFLEQQYLKLVPLTKIVLLRASIDFLLLMCNEMEDIYLNLPDLAEVTHVFFIILDSSQTHWSLVVVSIAEQLVVPYISLPRPYGNQDVVKSLVLRIAE